jgi:hypothetical protein
MVQTEGMNASNEDTLVALIASLQGLTLALQGKAHIILTCHSFQLIFVHSEPGGC